MLVGKPRINYTSLKKKRKNPADNMLNKAYVNFFPFVFHLA